MSDVPCCAHLRLKRVPHLLAMVAKSRITGNVPIAVRALFLIAGHRWNLPYHHPALETKDDGLHCPKCGDIYTGRGGQTGFPAGTLFALNAASVGPIHAAALTIENQREMVDDQRNI